MKRIKVRVKNKETLAEKLLYKAQKISQFTVENKKGILYEVFNVYYDGWIYFLVLANGKVASYMPITKV